jgi:hypothetical protein
MALLQRHEMIILAFSRFSGLFRAGLTTSDQVRPYVNLPISAWPRRLAGHNRCIVGALLARNREVHTVGKMVAVIEWGIIIVMYVRWKDVLPLLRDHLNEHFAAEANVPRLVASPIDRLLSRRVLGSPGAALDLGAVSFPKKREFQHLEEAGVRQPGHQAVGAQPVANDNDPAGLLVD